MTCLVGVLAANEEGVRERINAALESHRYETALALLSDALRLAPKDAELHDLQGVAFSELGQLHEARVNFELALRLNPRLSTAYYHLGLLEQRSGDLQAAIAAQQEALRNARGFFPARYALSALCWQIGDLDGAIRLLKQITSERPRAAEAWLNLGLALASKGGNAKEATEALRHAAAIDGKQVHAHLALAQLLADLEDWPEALAVFEKAKSFAPFDAEVAFNFGSALRSHGDLEGARAELERALSLDSRHAAAHRALGILFRQKGNYENARAELRLATELNGKDAESWRLLGAVALKLSEIEVSVAALERAVALNPDAADGRQLLAQALLRAGKTEEAERELKVALAAQEQQQARAQALLLLEKADEQQKAGNIATALATLKEAARTAPGFALAQYRLALASRNAFRPSEEVLNILAAARRAGAQSPEVHDLTATVLLEQGKTAEAMKEWASAIELAPSDLAARRSLGAAAMNVGRWKLAGAQFRAILGWEPDDLNATRDLVLCSRKLRTTPGSAAATRRSLSLRLNPE